MFVEVPAEVAAQGYLPYCQRIEEVLLQKYFFSLHTQTFFFLFKQKETYRKVWKRGDSCMNSREKILSSFRVENAK